jgi:hypothetical protein
MGVTNFPNGVGSFGIPVLPGATPAIRPGTAYFVCNRTNANGSDGNSGLSPSQPLATVNAAVAKCTASVGDTVYVMPGHAETVTATSIAHAVAGVTVIGLGVGTNRPTFTYGAAAATITITGANAAWRNCRFIANFADVAAAFTVGAAKGVEVTDCEFLDTSSSLNFLSCIVTGSTDNDADGLTFSRNYVYGLAVTDGAVVSILANNLRVQANDNIVDKAATNNAGHFITLSSKIVGGIRILRNYVTVVGATTATVGVFGTGSGSTSSGIIADNYVWSLDTTGGLFFTASTGIRFHNNFMSGAVDKSGTLMPAADDPA